MLSIALPHPWEDEGELVLHLLEECNSADRVECIGKVQGDQYPVWMVSLRRFLIPCTMFSAPPGMPTPNCTGENVPGSFSLRLHMAAELMSLWKMVPMAMGLMPPSFFGCGNQPSTKEEWSEVLWDELAIGSYLPFCMAYRWH